MRTVFLSAGHSNKLGKDMGAVGQGIVEGIEAVILRDMIVSHLERGGVSAVVDNPSNVLSETLSVFKKLTNPNSLVIDIHFNSASPSATGTEVIIPSEYNPLEYQFASELCDAMSVVLGIKNRGVKTELNTHHGRLGWMRLSGNNVLLEVCFLSNPSDVQRYNEKKLSLAQVLANTILRFAK